MKRLNNMLSLFMFPFITLFALEANTTSAASSFNNVEVATQ